LGFRTVFGVSAGHSVYSRSVLGKRSF
jgi:hypothetical protein